MDPAADAVPDETNSRPVTTRRPTKPVLSGRQVVAKLVVRAFGAGLLIFLLLPFYWMVKSAFQPNVEIVAVPPLWLPRDWTTEGFQRATTMIPFGRYILNSLFVSVVATVLATTLAAMAGYVLARFRFPGALTILAIFLLCQLIPPITRLFPVYFLIQNLGLINTYTGLIIAYMGLAVPLAALLLQGYFRRSCPVELEEAAYVDGCGYFKTFRKIVVPVSRSGIIAVGCFVFLFTWNDFLWASVLLYQGQMRTVQVGLREFIGEGGLQFANAFMAACLMTIIPAFILFRFVQRYMVEGLGAGATKG